MTLTAGPTSTPSAADDPQPRGYRRPVVIRDGVNWILPTGPEPDSQVVLEIIREHLQRHPSLQIIPPSRRICTIYRHPSYHGGHDDPLGDQESIILDILKNQNRAPLPGPYSRPPITRPSPKPR